MKKANITLTAKQISKKIAKNEIVFENEVQRAYVWDKDRKSALIDSIIYGMPVPTVYAKKGDKGVYDVLDGKQRLTTIYNYLQDNFPLYKVSDFTKDYLLSMGYELEEVENKKYSELPEELRDIIADTTFSVCYFDEITEPETREIFRRLNNGKPLSTKEKNVAYCSDFATITEISEHDIFYKLMSDTKYNDKAYVSVIMKMAMLLDMDYKECDFSSKAFNAFITKHKLTDAHIETINKTLNYFDCVLCTLKDRNKDIYKKLVKELNYISMFPFMVQFMENEENYIDMVDFVEVFFTNLPKRYIEASSNGTAKKVNIVERYEAIEEALESYKNAHKRVEFDF